MHQPSITNHQPLINSRVTTAQSQQSQSHEKLYVISLSSVGSSTGIALTAKLPEIFSQSRFLNIEYTYFISLSSATSLNLLAGSDVVFMMCCDVAAAVIFLGMAWSCW